MDNPLEAVWVVRGGDYNELAGQIATKGYVGVGWTDVNDISHVRNRDDLRRIMEEMRPGSGTPNAVGQLFRFANDICEGDYVLTPEKATKRIHISRCAGAYEYNAGVFGNNYPHVRRVMYLISLDRSQLPVTVRNTLGSTLTVFRADVALPYVRAATGPSPEEILHGPQPEENSFLWADEIEGQSRGQILEALDEIEHHDFQIFIAGLLEALGYESRVGRKGKDGGIDILAFPDVFGLASPRIKVQVKNQRTSAGIQDVAYLNGVLAADERGLFVCTGGFTTDAKNVAFVQSGSVALTDGGELLDLILEHYEGLPDRAKALLPLRKLWVPEKPVTD